MNDEHVFELLPGYALGALDDDDKQVVEAHLADCEVCQIELRAYQSVGDQLGLAAPHTPPPPHLKAEVMQRIAPQTQSRGAQKEPSGWRRLFSKPLNISPAWSLAGLFVVLALAISNLILWGQVSDLRIRASQGVELQTVSLAGTENAPGAHGVLVMSLDGRTGTLVVDSLPALNEELQYQLWLIVDGQRTDGGVFSVSKGGYGALVVWPPEPFSSYSAVGITIEPAGGSPGPTGDKVLGGDL